MEVPFADLGREVAAMRDEIDAAIARVIESGWFVLGEEGRAFEREFAAAMGAVHAVGVASGTDAIELGLRATGVGVGDEVITQANTCVPTVAGITRSGATPVLCDVNPESATINIASLEGAIGNRTRAVVPVHLYGQCADVDGISALCKPRGIAVVEDCAQAHGATLSGRGAGTMGDAGAFSFYPTKNLGAIGDGGAVVTSDPELAERLKLLRVYGQADRYRHVVEGVNSRLDELQAAILRVKLPRLEAANERRAEIAAAYTEALADARVAPLALLPGRRHAFHLYVVRVAERELFMKRMAALGIATLIHYPLPIHRQPAYTHLADGPVALSASDALAERIVSLPVYPQLTDGEVEHVCAALGSFS